MYAIKTGVYFYKNPVNFICVCARVRVTCLREDWKKRITSDISQPVSKDN
jgi:hypothetical protein